MPDLHTKVEQALRKTAEEFVLPRFTRLETGDIHHKAGDELVTIVDREVEDRLTQVLPELVPGSRVIGEEACAAYPALLESLDDGWVWLVDPIDGTRNFAEGRAPFAIMVALLNRGEVVSSWLLDPLSGRLCTAERGSGAWVNQRRLKPSDIVPLGHAVGIVSRAFLPPEQAGLPAVLEGRVRKVLPTQRCAGFEYPQVALGEVHFALYWRTLPWDHAAGTLFLLESGGVVNHLDGRPYRPAAPRPGLLLAANSELGGELLQLCAPGEG